MLLAKSPTNQVVRVQFQPGMATFTHMWFPRLKPGWAKHQKPTSAGQNWAKLIF